MFQFWWWWCVLAENAASLTSDRVILVYSILRYAWSKLYHAVRCMNHLFLILPSLQMPYAQVQRPHHLANSPVLVTCPELLFLTWVSRLECVCCLRDVLRFFRCCKWAKRNLLKKTFFVQSLRVEIRRKRWNYFIIAPRAAGKSSQGRFSPIERACHSLCEREFIHSLS